MNILSRCRIVSRSNSSLISRNFSDLTNYKPERSPGEQYSVWSDSNAAQVSNFHEILRRCARNGAAIVAKACHGRITRFELQEDITAWNVLINAYSRCGLLGLARQVFVGMPERNLVSWNTMIGLFTRNRQELEALKIFVGMRNEGVAFNEFTVSSVLCACGARCDALECNQLHGLSIKTCLDSNVFVGTALLDLYAKCGLIKNAVKIFESMQERSSVTWSSMVAAYVHNKFYEEALFLFRHLLRTNIEQNQFTISSIICACANLAALIEGKQIHCISCKTGFGSNTFVVSALLDMYSKCGSVKESYIIFSQVQNKNIVLWNAMISGFAKHARSAEVMILFEKMQQDGICPNEVTFSSLFSGCGHMGLVKRGQRFFKCMKAKYNVSPNALHYSCMVDVLGRAGQLDEAYELIESMPFDPSASIWGSLLASCRVYKNLKLAEIAAKKLFELEPENAGNHVLLSNIYAANKQWNEVAKSRKLLRDSDVKKIRGKSWIDIKDKVHTFSVGDRHHPRMSEIQVKLDDLLNDMKGFGYEIGVEHELHDVEEEKKEELLKQHSEKLAFVFGLMCLPEGSEVRIMKNLRICVDCHEFMKVASMATRREIIVRDVNRFHRFSDGHCSCGEFW